MQAYRIVPHKQLPFGLERFEREARAPGPHEVLVRVRAVSLNYRDLMITRMAGSMTGKVATPIPCSDGAGDVIAVGANVTRFRPGDRVAASFFPHWVDGPVSAQRTAEALGGLDADGMLAEHVVLPESAFYAVPAHLDYAEAATLPCAGVTAWNALFVEGRVKPGGTVLLLGTGGVSVWAMQLARAAGLKTLITSSSDEKLARARALGAHETINYRTTPEWQDEVLRLTHGQGVDMVVEVGGQDTLNRSIASLRMGGRLTIVGRVSGAGGAPVEPISLIVGNKHMTGVYVGSRAMAEDLCNFVTLTGIRPAVDRVFDFADAAQAYAYLESAAHFGKIIIRVGN
ncbi:NAD(P)-dependent alcohol dehydrogenase [Corallococcus sp. H22C18031201]|uniref:zinc-dependent alcohol dehydrogenase family protein n=1 Tax=Citreicoccus inhibens TaxID=2849499 RepID=UPI000E76FFAA|nr:NAD(P)-dependent alcohol dehydrogenase [Citreicoccus inhibens]MBU8896379.1 NAD(P)-dependent alcohol dehydrogenase [Citreicoccus inhibens]RJS17304.1 NAD(P)-dependent alcohol dehydrogenase [Corallococcus sp. H22C18031201]